MAIPQIEKNIANIQTIHTNVKNIYNDINNNIVPALNEAKAWATNAINTAKDVVNELQKAATHLQNNVNNINTKATQLKNTMNTEINNIRATFINFGNAIKYKAGILGNAIQIVGNELKEITVQMKPALDASIAHAKNAASYAGRGRVLAAIIQAYKSIEYLVFRGRYGQGAVIPELNEGFNEIKNAFIVFKDNFVHFGTIIKDQSANIANRAKSSVDNIANKTKALTNSIVSMGTDLKSDLSGIALPTEIPKESTTEPKPEQAPLWWLPENR